jgi:hypothetical protein
MPQPSLRRPLDEPDLRDDLRPHPLHLAHLIHRDAATPAGCLRVRQVDEGTLVDMVRLQRLEDLATEMRDEASPHLAREPQARVVVVPDEQSVDAVRPGAVAADRELLLVRRPWLKAS